MQAFYSVVIIAFIYKVYYNYYVLCSWHVFSPFIYFLVAVYYGGNPIVMYSTTECFAREPRLATALRMVQQPGALSIIPFQYMHVLASYKTITGIKHHLFS